MKVNNFGWLFQKSLKYCLQLATINYEYNNINPMIFQKFSECSKNDVVVYKQLSICK